MAQLFLSLLFILSMTPNLKAQQSYSGNEVLDCDGSNATGPSPDFLYTCNGKNHSCQAFLIYKSQRHYNTISRIANLLSSDPGEISRINNISNSDIIPTDKEIIIPVFCSCSGKDYQANTSFIIPTIHNTYFTIANYTYEGLSACNSLVHQNNYSIDSLDVGMEVKVPLRCACPTSSQTANGTNYLLTYLVSWGDTVGRVSKRFDASITSVIYANGFGEDDPTLFPFTTILVPLSTEPSSSQTIIHYPPPPYPVPFIPIHSVEKSSKGVHVMIVIGIPLLVLFFILSMLLLLHRKKRCLKARKGRNGVKFLPEDFFDRVAEVDQGLKIYEFEEVKVATEDFSTKNMLSGSMYRGVIGGQMVAIKKMSKDVRDEVNLLRKINHLNLINLYAACEHQGVFYLIYEFMENGSLRDWLYNKNRIEVQSWNCRLQIALDVANGLHYLHNFTDPPYVHKHICSSNVLLNRRSRAKIANFSLAHSVYEEEHVNSSMRLALGKKGYMAPEYTEFGLVTPEIDVYAFGVVLLELITAKDAVFMLDEREVQLSEAVISIMEGGNVEAELGSVVHPSIPSDQWMKLVVRMVTLSMACLEQEPESRPSIAEVVSSLSKIQLDVQKLEPYLFSGISV